jgi:O-antigen ligase
VININRDNFFLISLSLFLVNLAIIGQHTLGFFIFTFLVSLFYAGNIKGNLKKIPELRFFSYLILSTSTIVIVSAIANHGVEVLFTYQLEVFVFLPLMIFIFNAIASQHLNTEKLYYFFLISGLYALFYSILVFWYEPVRGEGLLNLPIHLGNVAIMYAVTSLVLLYFSDQARYKVLALVVFFSSITLSFLSGSKGGWLALVLVIISLWVYLFFKDRKKFWFFAFFIILFLTYIFIFGDDLPLWSRLNSAYIGLVSYINAGELTEGSVGPRLEIWAYTLSAISDFDLRSVLFGKGFMSFELLSLSAVDSGITQFKYDVPHAHNDYMNIFYELGLLGLLTFSMFFIIPVYFAVKNYKRELNVTNLLIVIVLVEVVLEFMLTNTALYRRPIFYTYLILIFLFITVKEKEKSS